MIPENKQPAVKKALQTAFNVDAFQDIQPLTKGLSSALVFKITVHGKPYLLRVATRTDAMGDPAFYYGCMKIAAEEEVAPRVHYVNVEDRISITDFIREQPFSIPAARQLMPRLLRRLHALPKFPIRINYFESMERFVVQFRASKALPEDEMKDLYAIYERIAGVYPQQDTKSWVSCHNDSKPENIVFDGHRPWFVDWEAAFLNDPYLDLAIVANFVVMNEQDEAGFLETYFERNADEYEQARLFLMQEILHFYYFIFLALIDRGEKPIDIGKISTRGFREFHDRMWDGEINLASSDAKREYAILHLEQFRSKAQARRLEDSLRIASRSRVS